MAGTRRLPCWAKADRPRAVGYNNKGPGAASCASVLRRLWPPARRLAPRLSLPPSPSSLRHVFLLELNALPRKEAQIKYVLGRTSSTLACVKLTMRPIGSGAPPSRLYAARPTVGTPTAATQISPQIHPSGLALAQLGHLWYLELYIVISPCILLHRTCSIHPA